MSRTWAGIAGLLLFCALVAAVQALITGSWPLWWAFVLLDMVAVVAFLGVMALLIKALDGMWPWDSRW